MDRLDGDGSQDHVKTSDQVDVSQQQQQQESSWFGGMFGALKPSSQGSSRNGITGKGRKALPPPGTYTSGEVHADFLKVCLSLFHSTGTITFSKPFANTDRKP